MQAQALLSRSLRPSAETVKRKAVYPFPWPGPGRRTADHGETQAMKDKLPPIEEFDQAVR